MKLFPLLLFLTGCASVTPNPALVVWNQPNPEAPARAHANEIFGFAGRILPTGSMEPFLTGGDWVVADFGRSWSSIKAGDLIVYDANWQDPGLPLICHMAVQRTGDGWVMTGIANQYSESGKYALMEADYRATVVAVYTSRTR